jgi:hypothetical protein
LGFWGWQNVLLVVQYACCWQSYLPGRATIYESNVDRQVYKQWFDNDPSFGDFSAALHISSQDSKESRTKAMIVAKGRYT